MGNVEHVSKNVSEAFKIRLQKVLDLIEQYEIKYEEIGVFGSYARGDYKISSDIDFCIVTDIRPDRRTSGSLREDAELIGADIMYVTRDYLETDNSYFAENLRKDYRRVKSEK